MRIIDSIPHPSMSISIFMMNNKYIVKFEAGPMEQSFKFTTEQVGGLDGLKQFLKDDFIEKTAARFKEMYGSYISLF